MRAKVLPENPSADPAPFRNNLAQGLSAERKLWAKWRAVTIY